MSVGIEHIDDLIEDFIQAFEKLSVVNETSDPGAKDAVPSVTDEAAKVEL